MQGGRPVSMAGRPASLGIDDETFYYDESTGAVYDSQGRLVHMPADFDASAIEAAPPSTAERTAVAQDQSATSLLPPSSAGAAPSPTRGTTPSAAAALGAGGALTAAGPGPSESTIALNSIIQRIDAGDQHQNQDEHDHHNPNYDNMSYVGLAFGGGDEPLGPGAELGGRASTRADTGPNESVGNLMPGGGKDSSESSAGDSKVKLDGDMMMMVEENGEYYAYPHTLDANDAKALEAAGYGMPGGQQHQQYNDQDGGIMMQSYPLGMGNGLMHPSPDGSPVGARGVRIVELEMETEEDSPYPEVRASVSNVDDPDMPVNTVRMWFLAIIFMTLAGGANQLFSLRFPAVYLTPVIVQLISYPAGKLLAATLPIRIWTLPRWLGGHSFSLNPGLFNIKEHTAIFIMANVATGPVYALNMIIVLDHPNYYNRPVSLAYSFLLSLTSQLFAFSFAGFVRKMLVYPASMIWPLNLVIATIFNTLHAEDDGEDGTMTRFRFFSIWGVIAFVFWFFPGFIFTALSAFNFVCWIWPNSKIVNILFGTGTGLGMSLITFDWSQIAFTGNPLVIPWWAQCNLFAGFVLIIWVVTPALYFSNTLGFAYLPISSSGAYDRMGQPYDVRQILAADGQTLDPVAYEAYSRINLSTTFHNAFWTGFATAGALLTHTLLYHGRAIVAGIRYGKVEEDDIHAKHMRVYGEAPLWWYLTVLVITFVLAAVYVEIYDTGLPVWGLLLSMLLPAIYILPTGFLYALTGQLFGLNLVSEFVAGYAFPGRTVPNMIFKVYAQTGLGAATNFLQDLKLGHYMKIPPRTTFMIQLLATAWCAIVQIGIKSWAFGHIQDICAPDAANRFSCPQARTFYTASIVFGVLGPDRIFGKGSDYSSMYWSILFGFLIPIPFWIAGKKWPNSLARWISWPIILTGSSYIPPATGINIASWFSVGLIFQYLLRKYNFRWWSKYNFVLAAALDAGTIVAGLLIFLTLQLPRQGNISLEWWGNTVFLNTLDFQGVTWRDVPPEGFGSLPRA